MNFKVRSLTTKVAQKNVLIPICWKHYKESALLLSSLILALGWGAAIPSAFAAERVTLRLGPFSPSVAVADLEEFAKSGELPSPLKVYAPVLTPQIREVLNRRLQLDPNLGDKLIKDVVRSPSGERLLNILGVAIPGSNLEQLQAAMAIALRQANGLSVVGFLRAYPTENITLDVGSAVAIAAQLNPTYLQSEVLGSLLESELAVKSDTLTNAAFDPATPGTQTVLKQTLTLRDRQRNRTIRVDVYWDKNTQPNGQATSPLVVMSHGFGADRKFLTYLARHLASHGLTVAALEHPGSNATWLNSVSAGTSDGKVLPATEFVDRPKDVSFLLDQLAQLNQESGPLQNKLNTEQVSVIGHSLGGYTALALAGAELNPSELRQSCKDSLGIGQAPADWLQCAAANLPDRKLKLRDQRVKNIIALNPLVGQLFGKTGLTQVETPVLMLAGTEDALTPLLNHQLRPFTQLHGPKYLLTAIGGTHLSIGDPENLGDTATASTLVKERQGEVTKSLRQLASGVSLAFIKQLTPAAKTYAPFLTPAYAQTLSTPELPLRLNSELPASVTTWIEVSETLEPLYSRKPGS